MKQYDSVKAYEIVKDDSGTHHHMQHYGQVIVISLEELKEVWDDGEYAGEQWAKYMSGGTFEEFIKEKGINQTS